MSAAATTPWLTFWLGRYPLASPTAAVQRVIPSSAIVPGDTADAPGQLGWLPSAEGDIPVVDGGALWSTATPEPRQQLLLLRGIPLAVAVTRVGEVMLAGTEAQRALPTWLAHRLARQGITQVLELGTLWFVIHWPGAPLSRWMAAPRLHPCPHDQGDKHG